MELTHFEWFTIATKKLEEVSHNEAEKFLNSQKLDRAIQIIRYSGDLNSELVLVFEWLKTVS